MSVKPELFVLIGAMDIEIEEYCKHLTNTRLNKWHGFEFYEGNLGSKEVVVVKSGIGKVFAAMITQKLIDLYSPSHIIFTGVAGALNTNYEIGDVVISKDCIQHDMDVTALGFARGTIPYTNFNYFKADATLLELAISTEIDHNLHTGRILTGDQFLSKKELNQYDYLTQELNGDAVEMEGAAVAQVCTINEIPFLIVRTISDKANEEASVNFNNLLPEIAKNSFLIVHHILNNFTK
tara:strand:+ start:12663 stop:13373 length:711 start_codon:yes stop_codon:yes gene_type:complete